MREKEKNEFWNQDDYSIKPKLNCYKYPIWLEWIWNNRYVMRFSTSIFHNNKLAERFLITSVIINCYFWLRVPVFHFMKQASFCNIHGCRPFFHTRILLRNQKRFVLTHLTSNASFLISKEWCVKSNSYKFLSIYWEIFRMTLWYYQTT